MPTHVYINTKMYKLTANLRCRSRNDRRNVVEGILLAEIAGILIAEIRFVLSATPRTVRMMAR